MFRESVTPVQATEIVAKYWVAPTLSREDKIARDWRLAESLDRLADKARGKGEYEWAQYLADRALDAANRAISH